MDKHVITAEFSSRQSDVIFRLMDNYPLKVVKYFKTLMPR